VSRNVKTAYKFRIYPNKQWESVGVLTLETCRHLWNDALADRKNTWKQCHTSTSYEDQAAILTLEKQDNPYLKGVFSQVEQDVLRRLKKAFDNFFRRVREHAKKKGYLRFKAEGRYNSFTYPQSGFKLEGSRLTLSKFPCPVRVFLHREIEGNIKTCTIKRDGTGRWYAIFTTERETPDKVDVRSVVGVDLGISHAVVTSDGQTFDYPRYYVQAEKKLRYAQKTLHRRKLGSENRKKAAIKVAEVSRRVVNQSDEFLHKVSRELVDSADAIIFEDLTIGNMLKNHHLAKHISDVSWGKLVQFARSKAERAGKSVVLVDPRNTSQRCSGCGTHVQKVLAERTHCCPKCGLTLDRDHNAALNILALGLRVLACGELTSTLGRTLNLQANSTKQEALPLQG
jgi:putative transposase